MKYGDTENSEVHLWYIQVLQIVAIYTVYLFVLGCMNSKIWLCYSLSNRARQANSLDKEEPDKVMGIPDFYLMR
jgi:hypothetical protein